VFCRFDSRRTRFCFNYNWCGPKSFNGQSNEEKELLCDACRILFNEEWRKGWTDNEEKEIFAIGSFYFWLDIMATFSMIFEIPWLSSYSSDGVDSNFDNVRAGKVSKADAKEARLTRMYKYFIANITYRWYNIQ